MSPITVCNVAVIGAGAAGLAAARHLDKEGHTVVVFEKQSQLGGTWIYTPTTEPDLLGLDPNRTVIHSSLYDSLRTNLPREAMSFREYPFVSKKTGERDPRRFPGHGEVLEYLKEYATEFGLSELVRFETEVSRVKRVGNGKWEVRSRKISCDKKDDVICEGFDAVVVCNGHYSEPRIAHIPGVDGWPGTQIHSHNYRAPDPFINQVVVLIGSAASAVDISREIVSVAKEVHIASWSTASSEQPVNLPGYHNIWLRPMIERAHEDGTISFPSGFKVYADVILHCTGYKYSFAFLDTEGIVSVDNGRVGPLYKHVFPPLLSPWLSFVGLPKILPFPLFELQCEWISGILSGRISLPSPDEMMKDVEAFYSSLQASGVPKRHTHHMPGFQFEYNDWIATQCGCPKTEEWRKKMYEATALNKKVRPETYRDEWEDEDLVVQAYQDFAKQISCKHISYQPKNINM